VLRVEQVVMRIILLLSTLVIVASAAPRAALSEASGPDTWDVTGVSPGDVLYLHKDANARSPSIAGIPHDAKGLRNLGCTGTPTFQQWMAMSESERSRSARARWCRVDFAGARGWVAGRFLREGAGGAEPRAASIGPWMVRCPSTCVLEQRGLGTTRLTTLRLERREGTNAQITVERAGIARQGTLAIHMDGELITMGPISSFKGSRGQIVMPPDDITLGIVKQMSRHKNMVINFPGEERGVEIHLDRFEEAWRELERRSRG
jgi:hypothetical protein